MAAFVVAMQVLVGGPPAKRVGINLLGLAANDRSDDARELRHWIAGLQREPGSVARLYVRPSTAPWIAASGFNVPHAVAPFEGAIVLTRLWNRVWLRARRTFDHLDAIEQVHARSTELPSGSERA